MSAARSRCINNKSKSQARAMQEPQSQARDSATPSKSISKSQARDSVTPSKSHARAQEPRKRLSNAKQGAKQKPSKIAHFQGKKEQGTGIVKSDEPRRYGN